MSERAEATGAVFRGDPAESEALQRFRSLVNSIDDGIYQVDVDGRIVAVNDALVGLAGRAREELLGEHLSALLGDADAATVERAIDRRAADPSGDTDAFEVAVRTADGERLPCELRLNAIVEDGSVRGAAGIVREAGDRERTARERQLQRERDLIDRVLETSPVGIIVVDSDGEVARTNGRAREILAIADDERGKYSPADRETYDEDGEPLSVDDHPFAVALETGEPVYDRTLQVERPGGERRWLRVNAAPILTPDGEVDRVVTIGEDVTEIKERERELESELSEVFGRVSDAFYALDDQWRFTHINDRAEELLGRSADDLRGEVLWDAFPEAVGSKLHDRFREAMETQEPTTFERYSEPLGIWTEVHAYPSGTGLSVYFRDVTERKEMERELGERRRQLSTLMDNVPGMVYRCRNERGWPMAFVSEGARELTGYGAEALERGDVSYGTEVVVEADRDELWEEIQQGIEDREQFSVTYRIETAAGDLRWVRDHGRAIVEDGEVAALEGVIIDVTERKRLENELSEVFGRVSDAFYALDDQWRITHANDRAEELIDYRGEGLVGENIWDVFEWGYDSRLGEEYRRAMETQDPTSFELYYPDPLDAWYEVNAYPSATGLSVYFRDVTERKERERQLEQSEQRYRTLAEYFPNGIVTLFDDDLRYTLAAGQGFDDISVDPADLEGEWFRDAWDDETADALEPALQAVLDGEERSVELSHEGREWLVRAAPVTDERGDVFAGMTMAQDITHRKQYERRLEESERRYRTLVENFPNGAVALFDEDLRYTAVGGGAFEDIGDSSESIVGQTVRERYPPELADQFESNFRAALRGETNTFEIEFHGRHWSAYTLPVEEDDGGVFGGMIMVQDITERKARQRALERSERQYRTLVEQFPNGAVALVDEDLRYRTIGGTPPRGVDAIEELEGLPARKALPPALAEKLVPRYEAAFEGESGSFEHESDGRVYQFRVVPVRSEDGEIFAAMGMSQDITERKERERDLREAKTQLEAATEAGAVGTWEWNIPDDRFVAGPSLARTFGVDPEAARDGLPLERFTSSIYEADRERVRRKIEDAVEACGEYEAEYRVWNADDELRWVVARGHVEADENGDPVSFPGALIDITERKRAERELERHKDQLETLFEVLPVGVVVADADGELVEANETAREIWGGEVFDAESVAEYDRYTAWWADTGDPVGSDEWTMARVLRGEEIAEPDVFEIETADGKRRIVTADGKPIRDERGEVVRGVVTLTDVTERREYRRKLEASEQRYRTLVENFPNGGVGVFDDDLRYTLVEGTMWDDIDPDAADLEGQTIRDALPPDTADDVEPIFRAALEGETDSVVSTLGGRTYRVWATPLRDADGEVTAGQSFAVDITDQLERERQLEESNERLEQFAYAASHDLQEPLRMVSSYLQLIERRYADDFDEEGREFLAFAVDGAERMREMIDSLLAYSRVETAGDPLEPVDLNDVLDDVRTDMQVQIAERDAAVTVGDLPRVEGDEGQLRQLFQNLLGNALEYSGDEPPRVRVGAERSESEWTLSVSDEGIGIAPENQERIFEVFQRLHTVDEHAGTGVGLALCQRIVERHGGDIWVESEQGEGSTFYFTLPAVEDE